MRYSEDAWLAGFVDGEASFTIDETGIPRMTIKLRVDDLAVLEDLHATFGGGLTVHPGYDSNSPNPSASWHVVSKRDLAGLLDYFERFPLRAKKSRDYAIWSRAARLYCAHGRNDPEVLALRIALNEGRRFNADEHPAIPEHDRAQLRLVEEG